MIKNKQYSSLKIKFNNFWFLVLRENGLSYVLPIMYFKFILETILQFLKLSVHL